MNIQEQHGTQETRELVAAAIAVRLCYQKGMADGRFGWADVARLLFESPAIRRAIDKVHLVPAEMLDITDAELPAIVADISAILKSWGQSYRTQDISGDVVRGLHTMLPTAKLLVAQWTAMMDAINARPPSAIRESEAA